MLPNLTQVKELIDNSQKILLINHRKMDGDAYGSLSAFYLALKKMNKDIKAINDELTPDFVSFILARRELFEPELDIKKYNPDIIISFDASTIDQLGGIYEKHKEIFSEKTLIVIDHHMSNEGFGDINIIDKEASSTCEVVYRMMKKYNIIDLMDEDMASLLLLGIITDTGGFTNGATNIKSLEIASDLLSRGARHTEIITNLFKKRKFEKLKLWGKALTQMKNKNGNNIIWISIQKELFGQTGTTTHDISGLINEMLVTVEDSKIIFLIYENETGEIKGSLRSNTDVIDVSILCTVLGGGGHKKAGGFILSDISLIEAEELLLEKIEELYGDI